ncbi:TPA: hypothetical protein L6A41_07080 [Pseudomonas aeruginosa]|uniref:hypothetical protein n=1 Tax=Pseudomonas aeruginosa TaxID=287 RepID=UPI00249E8F72|nr:hypothetical protein [Pseudomonas aeruginosa]EIW4149151.1 hypothetical protein [Pseudomonas aeruginosa]EKU5852393.1 hypothetical protein [Pseudomonas aeruginosa]WGX57589.1 hypothetical protein P7I93_11855 [Pseudomonas aeruginosa]HBP5969470.1 hypothetical protein [Pseudomonas aeruginosa]HBP5971017.1 hypothetical protein [Pseudomonas aeruginosa]
MSIDWSKAPEGATHLEPKGTEFGEGWMKKVGNEWSYWLEGSEVWAGVWADCFVSAEREATFEARPQETWDGKGLPPVGLMVEWKAGLDHDWQRVTVLAYANGDAWFQPEDGPSFIVGNPANFRRIRTPEQIAAEERSKECDRIFVILSSVEREGNRSDMAEALYDAGYRRQEEGK